MFVTILLCFFNFFCYFWTSGKSPEALPSNFHTNFSIRIDPRHPETPIPCPDFGNPHFLFLFGRWGGLRR